VSAPTLQVLIGTALTDAGFCRALLNGSRQTILERYPLSRYEFEILMAIRADSLEQFAGEAHRRLLSDCDELEPLSVVYRQQARRARASSRIET
jgi:hypothetical protein